MADQRLNLRVTQTVDKGPLRELQSELRKVGIEQARLYQEGKKDSQTFRENQNEINRLKSSIKELQGVMRGFQGKSPLSGFQFLEAGENITVIAAGLRYAAQAAANFTKELYDSAKAGAEFTILLKHFEQLNGGIEEADKLLNQFRQASAGNLDAEQLIKYSNEMSSLGYSTETTTKILDIVERKADEVGVSFDEGNAALQKFITTGAGRGLIQLGINVGAVQTEMERLTGKTSKQIGELSELEQQTIRTDAVTSLYGNTLEEISQKQKDSADTLQSLNTLYSDLKQIIGAGLGGAFAELASGIQVSDNALASAISNAEYYGRQAIAILKLLAAAASGDPSKLLDAIAGYESNSIVNDVQGRFIPEINVTSTSPGPRGKSPIGSKGGKTSTIKEVTNDIKDLEKQIGDLRKKLEITPSGTNLFYKYTQDIEALQKQINFLNSGFGKITSRVGSVTDLEGLSNKLNNRSSIAPIDTFPYEIAADNEAKKKRQEGLAAIQTSFESDLDLAYQISDVFGLASATNLLNDFNSIYSLVKSIFNITSIFGGGGLFGLLGGLFGGGAATSGGGGAASLFSPAGNLGNRGSFNINLSGQSVTKGTDIVTAFRKTVKIETALIN